VKKRELLGLLVVVMQDLQCAISQAHYLHSMHSRGFYPRLLIVSNVDFELHPTVSLKERSFNVLVAPREHFIEMLNRNLNLQRFEVLFVTGDFSGILSRLHRRFTELEIRQGFTTIPTNDYSWKRLTTH